MFINNVLININKARILGSSDQCYDIMYSITRAFQVKTMVEIGTHQGASCIVFCQAILDNKYIPKIYTIDNWSEAQFKQKAESNLNMCGFLPYVTMIDGDSKIVIPELFSTVGKVDLILIDGYHNSVAVEGDFLNCKDFSDVILFHDTLTGDMPYLKMVRECGFNVTSFPTRFVEGDGHLVGISLAIKGGVK